MAYVRGYSGNFSQGWNRRLRFGTAAFAEAAELRCLNVGRRSPAVMGGCVVVGHPGGIAECGQDPSEYRCGAT
jgi:hypothetical protein